MRRFLFVIFSMVMLLVPLSALASWYYGIYYDKKTSALLASSFTAELLQEKKAAEYLDDIFNSYVKADAAITGMYLTKHLERKALHSAGILGVPGQENYYYQHIYKLVYERIIPEILRCGVLLIDHIDQIYIWGPQLASICDDVHSLCQQFSAVVSNGTLTFNFSFPKVSERVLEMVGVGDLAQVDWKDFFDSLASIDVGGVADSIGSQFATDFDDLYSAGKDLLNTGGGALDTLWANRSKAGKLLQGKPKEIKHKLDSLKEFFSGVTDAYDVQGKFKDFMGTVDSLTMLNKFFEYRNCDPMQLIHDFGQDARNGTYVRERWYIERGGTLLYEEWFDSYTMDRAAFGERMEGRLQELKVDDPMPFGPFARLHQDQRTEYRQTEELRLKAATQAIFKLTCDDGGSLVEGAYQFKVNPSHPAGSLCPDCKKYVMETRVDPNEQGAESRNTATDKITYWNEQYSSFDLKWNTLDQQIAELNNLYGQGQMTYEGEDIAAVINRLTGERNTVGRSRQAAKDSLDLWTGAYGDLMEDLMDDGDIERIPHIMNEVQGLFSLRWLDDGHWEGYTWVRKAYMASAQQEVTLRVQLELARTESHNWLIGRYHRSIIRQNFKVVYAGTSENVVEYLDLNPDNSEAENRRIVNEHLQNWRNQFPECSVSVETQQQPGVEDSISNHKVHLLWASDRLRVARDINARLEMIHARLQVMERTLLYTKSLWNRVRDEVHNIVTDPIDKSWCYGLITDRTTRMRANMNAAPLRRRQNGYEVSE